MPASALLAAASVASLNLCTDEYLLLLAQPPEIASVSFLSQDPLESPLWQRARRHHANRGSLEQVVGRRPSIVLTMGGGGRATTLISRRLGIRTVELKPNATLSDVEVNLRMVAAVLGQPRRAQPLLARIRSLRLTTPPVKQDAIWLTGGGDSLASESSGAEWLSLAGLRQRPLQGGRATFETLLVSPPTIIIQSNYRLGQVSRDTQWLRHPAMRRTKSRRIATDGRAWTCMGPLLIEEIERLRGIVQ